MVLEKESPLDAFHFENPISSNRLGGVGSYAIMLSNFPAPGSYVPRNILITGASGYIGASMVSHLLGSLQGTSVIAMVSSDEQAVTLHNLVDSSFRSRLMFRIGRLPDQIPDLSGIDSIVHLAGIRKITARKPLKEGQENGTAGASTSDVVNVNQEGTRKLIDAACAARIHHFIFISSQSVYGTKLPVPWSESQQPSPEGVYAASKYASEQLLQEVHYFSTTILRVPRVYGLSLCNGIRGMDWNEVPNVLIARAVKGNEIQIKGDGRQSYDFLHLKDLCTAVERALILPPSGCRVLNLSSSMPISMKGLAELCCDIAARLGVKTPPIMYESHEGIPASFGLNSALARHELQWHSEVTMQAGIEELMKHMLTESGV